MQVAFSYICSGLSYLSYALVLLQSFTALWSMTEISSHRILIVLYNISAPKVRAHRPSLSDVFCT